MSFKDPSDDDATVELPLADVLYVVGVLDLLQKAVPGGVVGPGQFILDRLKERINYDSLVGGKVEDVLEELRAYRND